MPIPFFSFSDATRALTAACLAVAILTPLPSRSQTSDSFDFLIAAQPLAQALIEFSRITQLQVSADAEYIEALESNAVRGTLSPRAALEVMTSGTGLEVVTVNGGSFAVRAVQMEDPEAPSAAVIEEVLVYGTKQNLSLQEIATSVSLYTQEQIEQQALFTLGDLIIRTPNVSSVGAGNAGAGGLSIRGISISGVGGAGTGQTASIYVDGTPNSNTSGDSIYDMWDIEQVEVLRGPQSITQGRNALAGAIYIATVDPGDDLDLRLRVSAGNEETRQYSGALTLPIVAEQLSLRLSADQRSSEYDIVFPEFSDDPAVFWDAATYRAKLVYEPTWLEPLRLEISHSRAEVERGNQNAVNGPLPFDAPGNDFDPFGGESFIAVGPLRAEDEVDRTVADADIELTGPWSIKAIVTRERAIRDQGNTDIISFDVDEETWTGELRLHYDADRLRGAVGAYYFDRESSFEQGFSTSFAGFGITTDPPDSLLRTTLTGTGTTENYAVFASLEYDLGRRWSINAGFRYDYEDFLTGGTTEVTVSPSDCVIPAFGGLPCGAVIPTGDDESVGADFSAFLPAFSLSYKPADDQLVSFGVQRGYRAGGSYTRNDFETGTAELLGFDPEYITNYELAYRSQWLGKRLTFNANVYFADWEDQQVEIPGSLNSGFDRTIVNVGESELYGAELSLSAQLADAWDGFVTLGLAETEFTEFPFAEGTGTEFESLAGNTFPVAPNTTASAGLNYRHESGLYGNVTISFTGRQYGDVTNLATNRSDSWTLLNARVGYEMEHFDLYVYGTNITDEEFLTIQGQEQVVQATGAVRSLLNPFYRLSDPRILGVVIEYRM